MDLAKKYHVAKSTVSHYGAKFKWVQLREEHRDEQSAITVQHSLDAKADAIVRLSSCVYEAAADLAEKLMIEIKQKYSLKSYEYKNYSSTLIDLAKLLPDSSAEQKESEQKFVAILPDRTEIDEGG